MTKTLIVLLYSFNTSKPKRHYFLNCNILFIYIDSEKQHPKEIYKVLVNSRLYIADHKKPFVIKNTHFLPFSSGNSPASIAARAVAPAPSTTAFSNSTNLRIAKAMYSSLKSHKKAHINLTLSPVSGLPGLCTAH